MSITVPVVMIGWPFAVILLFALLPARRAIITGMLVAWLFLPMTGFKLSGLPDITKMSITCVSVLLGISLFDPGGFARIRGSWSDFAMVCWLIVPVPSCVISGFGIYEGLSACLNHLLAWGIPYLIGRMYFTTPEGLRELAIGLFIAGLIYIPFVLYEARMSPQLHKLLYGFHQHQFGQSKRMGGWRPMVFMQHGLAVAMYMATASLCGLWMSSVGKFRFSNGISASVMAIVLSLVAINCKSLGSILLLALGVSVLYISRWWNTRKVIIAILLIGPVYISARTVGSWDGKILRDVVSAIGQDRATSLGVRMDSEDRLWKWVKPTAILGRARLGELMDDKNREFGRFIPDGLWLIALGKYGMVGLISMLGILTVPALSFLFRHPPASLFTFELSGATVMTTILALYSVDNLFNAMVNPVFLLASGGLPLCKISKQYYFSH